MRFEARTVDVRQAVPQVVGDELHELAAGHLGKVVVDHVGSAASKYCSSALRTFERARWSSTRWLVSLRPRTLHASSAGIPSRSRSTSTSRWPGGRASI